MKKNLQLNLTMGIFYRKKIWENKSILKANTTFVNSVKVWIGRVSEIFKPIRKTYMV